MLLYKTIVLHPKAYDKLRSRYKKKFFVPDYYCPELIAFYVSKKMKIWLITLDENYNPIGLGSMNYEKFPFDYFKKN